MRTWSKHKNSTHHHPRPRQSEKNLFYMNRTSCLIPRNYFVVTVPCSEAVWMLIDNVSCTLPSLRRITNIIGYFCILPTKGKCFSYISLQLHPIKKIYKAFATFINYKEGDKEKEAERFQGTELTRSNGPKLLLLLYRECATCQFQTDIDDFECFPVFPKKCQ